MNPRPGTGHPLTPSPIIDSCVLAGQGFSRDRRYRPSRRPNPMPIRDRPQIAGRAGERLQPVKLPPRCAIASREKTCLGRLTGDWLWMLPNPSFSLAVRPVERDGGIPVGVRFHP